MKDLFANLYNKVLSFFHQAESKDNESAKDVACNRLKLVLMQDRTNLSPAIMDRMRHELIDLLSKYLELDRELLDLSFEHEDEQMALMLSIPVIRAKDEQEIEEILRKEDEAKKTDESEQADESEEENSEDEIDEISESETDDEDAEDETSETEESEDSEDDADVEEEVKEEVKEEV